MKPAPSRRLDAAHLRPLPSVVLQARKQEILAIVRDHRGTDVRVFGSVARGEDRTDSDIDLLVNFDTDADLFDLVALELALEGLLGCSVDVLPTSSTGRAVTRAARDAVPL